MSKTSSRKKDHIDIALARDVSFREKTTGLEKWEFIHNALPEVNFNDVDPSVVFLNHRLSLPLIVSSMTGGYEDAERVNRGLAEVCEAKKIAMGVGSQRQAIENSFFHRSFKVVREAAPGIPVVGNIGAAEIASMTDMAVIRRLAEMIEASAFAVHLNPLQEMLQPEGNPRFKGVLKGIESLVRQLDIPVIVKEIGAGISRDVARRLIDAGVRYIDVAGAGGTSWAGVEIMRSGDRPQFRKFWDWGIPTADSILQVVPLKNGCQDLFVIASGGISSGLDTAKAIALGADLAGSARPMLTELERGGTEALAVFIDQWGLELRSAMFLTGSSTIAALQKAHIEPRNVRSDS